MKKKLLSLLFAIFASMYITYSNAVVVDFNSDFDIFAGFNFEDGLDDFMETTTTANPTPTNATVSIVEVEGGHAVQINGDRNSSNMRLHTEAITLEAGKYMLVVDAKAATDNAKIRMGYTLMKPDGTYEYKYTLNATDLIIDNDFVEIRGSVFTLSAETDVTLFIANSGKTGNAIICDNLKLYKYTYTCHSNVIISNNVSQIPANAFEGCIELTSITIPNSVTSIGGSAFKGCTSLTSITIPNSVTSIGGSAFKGCTSLTSITIPNSVTSIDDSTFEGCTNLTSVTIGNSVTNIGNYAFEGCTSLANVTIPNSVTTIGGSAFSGCTSLMSVNIIDLDTWCRIDFNNYTSNPLLYAHNLYLNGSLVTNLVIPETITQIRNYAFYGCTGLTSITIPNSVTNIGSAAFFGCTGLTNIVWNVIDYASSNAFNDIASQITSFVFGENVQTIPASLCSGMSNLTSISIPENVTSIGINAFRDCTGLKNIFWNAVNYTSYDPFSGITKSNISSFKFGENVQIIPSSLCSGMSNLTSISIPNSVTSIGSGAFYGCSDLTNMIIPNSVTIIGSQAFYECTGLTSVTIGNNVTRIGRYTFYGCTGLTSVTIPNSVTSIEEETFSGCSGLTSVSIGENVRTIGNNTFKDCIGLENLYCYRTLPPNAYSTAFDGVDKFACVLHVPSESIDYYKNAAAWRDFFYVTILGAETAEVTALTITPHEDNADVMWPAVVNAYSYEFTITDSNGNTVCTLTFNANGQLTGLILHAPAADGVMQRAAAGTGFSFNVTGLENGNNYSLVIKAKDSNGVILQTFSQDFTTGATALENVNADGASGIRKVIEDGKVVIVMPDGRKFDASGRKLR